MSKKKKIFYILSIIFFAIAAISFLFGISIQPDNLGFFGNFGQILLFMIIIPISSLALCSIFLMLAFWQRNGTSDLAKERKKRCIILCLWGVVMITAGYFRIPFYTFIGFWGWDAIANYMLYIGGAVMLILGICGFVRKTTATTQT